jgi:SAM-dependent methyltransferase
MDRPFYTSFAWAYDVLIVSPVSERIDFILTKLAERGIFSPARVLDAGCGTGNYSIALAEKGFEVVGLDASNELLAQAHNKLTEQSGEIKFVLGDILDLPTNNSFDMVLCRGVLNDIIEEAPRKRVFHCFANSMCRGGVLIIDVRNWIVTEKCKREEPVFEKSLLTDRGLLKFRSEITVQPETKCLYVLETHTLDSNSGAKVDKFKFVMKCWTKEEIAENLSDAGFGSVEYLGDYKHNSVVGATDRIVVVASLQKGNEKAG